MKNYKKNKQAAFFLKGILFERFLFNFGGVFQEERRLVCLLMTPNRLVAVKCRRSRFLYFVYLLQFTLCISPLAANSSWKAKQALRF